MKPRRQARKGHPLASRKAIDPKSLVGGSFIYVSNTAPALHNVIDDYIQRSGLGITATHEADNPAMAFHWWRRRAGEPIDRSWPVPGAAERQVLRSSVQAPSVSPDACDPATARGRPVEFAPVARRWL